MANQAGNFGFRPVQMLGGAYNGQGQQELSIASNETNSIFQGDPVVLNANGSISRGSSAGAELIGIFNGCFYKFWTPHFIANQIRYRITKAPMPLY